MMAAALAVRDAMLQVFSLGQPVGAASDSTGANGSPAAKGAAAGAAAAAAATPEAAGSLAPPAGGSGGGPKQQQAAQQQQQQQQQQEQQAVSMDTDAAAAPVAEHAAAQDGAAAPGARAGSGGGSGGSEEVEEVQPASHRVLQDPRKPSERAVCMSLHGLLAFPECGSTPASAAQGLSRRQGAACRAGRVACQPALAGLLRPAPAQPTR